MTSAKGAVLTDSQGKRYLDYIGGWGPHILGHAHPAVTSAIAQAAARSTTFGAPTEAETELAEIVVAALRGAQMMRLVNSGTEACMTALRLARGVTGRDLIVKFAGCYHGHADSLLVSAGSGALTHGRPSSSGVPKELAKLTLVLPFNDLDAVERCFRAKGRRIAALIVEPVAGNMGVVVPKRGFLEGLRSITAKYGSLLIFDEVMTGFRLAWGGAQSLFEIEPDITTLGKVIGGGTPLAAVAGPAPIMQQLAPLGPVYQAGTLSGNPLAVAAGIATLQEIKGSPRLYRQLEVLSARLAFGLEQALYDTGVKGHVCRFGSMLTLFFTPGPIHNLQQATRSDTVRFSAFHRAMLERGIYLPPSQFEAWFVSAAHTFEHIDTTITAARQALKTLR